MCELADELARHLDVNARRAISDDLTHSRRISDGMNSFKARHLGHGCGLALRSAAVSPLKSPFPPAAGAGTMRAIARKPSTANVIMGQHRLGDLAKCNLATSPKV
jgi:hypothetical protein